jgi:hypothetical protein
VQQNSSFLQHDLRKGFLSANWRFEKGKRKKTWLAGVLIPSLAWPCASRPRSSHVVARDRHPPAICNKTSLGLSSFLAICISFYCFPRLSHRDPVKNTLVSSLSKVDESRVEIPFSSIAVKVLDFIPELWAYPSTCNKKSRPN